MRFYGIATGYSVERISREQTARFSPNIVDILRDKIHTEQIVARVSLSGDTSSRSQKIVCTTQ